MPRVRRTEYLYLYVAGGRLLDVAALLRGRAELAPATRVVALSILAGDDAALSPAELELLLSLPGDGWVEAEGAEAERLARAGVVVSDGDDPWLAELRRRDERLSADGWHPHAALLHFVGKWRGVELGGETDFLAADEGALAARYDDFVARHGPPPPPFHSRGGERVELPLVERAGGLYDALARRRTTRVFDADAPVAAADLSLLLRQVFGCHAIAELTDGVVVLGKTSPSGGARHSLEAYPLLANVEGIEPGLYHYDARGHALELVRRAPREEVAALVTRFSAGQAWFAGAAAAVVVTSRFRRTLWKYARNNRAYLTVFLEAGHFSQSFYLVCADLGLGAFVTAAVNGGDVEDELGLDPVDEGVVAICGCGVPIPGPHPLHPPFRPYVPRSA